MNPQSDLSELRDELFPKNKEKVLLFDYIKCENHIIDSSLQIRRNQPDFEKTVALLQRIISKKRGRDFLPLKDIYLRHLDNFRAEWENAFISNYYSCDAIREQYGLLSEFETALTSLSYSYRKLSNKEIFEEYTNRVISISKIPLRKGDPCKLKQKISYFSDYYKSLAPCSHFAGTNNFTSIDPYKDQLSPLVRSYLSSINNSDTLDIRFHFFILQKEYVAEITDSVITDYFIKEYPLWRTNKKDNYIYSYAGTSSDGRLATYLTKQILKEKKALLENPVTLQLKFNKLLLNRNNLDEVIDVLLKQAETDFNTSLTMFSFLPLEPTEELLNNKINTIYNIKKNLLPER